MFIKPDFTKLILSLTGLFTIIMGILLCLHPPALFPDPSWGFQVLRGMQKGGGFNMLPNPDMMDISKPSSAFLSWWSPGQYLVPYFFIYLFKINIGRATALTILLCSLTGLAGFYVCFNKLGFTKLIAAISIAFIACQQAYVTPYAFYNGGEVLLFAFSGWFLYGCTYYNKVNIVLIIFIFLSGIIGFFCKSSFLWIYFSGLLYLWIRMSSGKKLPNWLINGFTISIPAVLSLAVIYLGYLSKGGNPASGGVGLKLAWETFCFPLASPLLAGFSIDDLTNSIISQPIGYLILLAIFSVILVIYTYRNIPYNNYKLLFIILYIIAILFFSINFLRQANISYESRHMRIVGLFITPGIIYLFSRPSFISKLLFAIIWVFIACNSFKTIINAYKRNKYYSAHASSGIAQIFIDQPTLDYITELDQTERDAVFVFVSPDIGLEIIHNSIITYDPLDNGLQPENELNVYDGHSGPLHIILPKSYIGPKANTYIKCFPGYTNFNIENKSEDYVIYTSQ